MTVQPKIATPTQDLVSVLQLRIMRCIPQSLILQRTQVLIHRPLLLAHKLLERSDLDFSIRLVEVHQTPSLRHDVALHLQRPVDAVQARADPAVGPALKRFADDHDDFLVRLVRHRDERAWVATIFVLQAGRDVGEDERDDSEVVVRPDSAHVATVEDGAIDGREVVDADRAGFVGATRGEDFGVELHFLRDQLQEDQGEVTTRVEKPLHGVLVAGEGLFCWPLVGELLVAGMTAIKAFLPDCQ